MKNKLIFIALLFCFVSLARDSYACSCWYQAGGFLIKSGQALPSNAKGVAWWGKDPLIPLPPKIAFSIERLEANKQPIPVEFNVMKLTHELLFKDLHHYRLAVISPSGGFKPGSRYRFTYYPEAENFLNDEALFKEKEIVEVTISSKEIHIYDSPNLKIYQNGQGKVVTETHQGSCSTEIDAYRVGVEMSVPNDVKDAFLYFVKIDNKRLWRPATSYCDPSLPGKTSDEIGKELLFTWCSRSPTWAKPSQYLQQGKYHVEMIAWLPGTSIQFSDSTDIELFCK